MGKIWFPLQRAIRTAVAVFLAAVTVLGVIVVVALQVVTALQDVLPGPVIAWATGAIATLTAISAAVSRVMAIPQIDAFLKRFGAGSAPAGAVPVTFATGETVGMTRRQWRAYIDNAGTAPTTGDFGSLLRASEAMSAAAADQAVATLGEWKKKHNESS